MRSPCIQGSGLLLWLGWALLLSAAGEAQEVDCVVSSQPAEVEGQTAQCDELAEPKRWRVGLGLGYGERSNPRLNGDDTELYAIVQLAYFGDRFFFDNGDVGASLFATRDHSVNLIAGVGGERSLFSLFNDESFGFVPDGGTEIGDQSFFGPPGLRPVSLADTPAVEPPERKYTLDGGLEWIYQPAVWDIKAQLLTDISGRHKGHQLWLSGGRLFERGHWSLYGSLGLNWKSGQAAHYFYGISEAEAQLGLPTYKADAALTYYSRASLSYRLSEHWSLISILHYERFDAEIRSSPVMVEDEATTIFLGLYYGF